MANAFFVEATSKLQTTISVLIPAYNAANFILEALDSVSAQSRPPDQIIVVDDGSTDNTTELVRRWSADKCIAVDLIRQKNMGLPGARNRGIRQSGFELIALLDADDLYLPDHLAKMEHVIRSQPGVIAAFGDGVTFGPSGIDSAPFSRCRAIAAASTTDGSGIYILGKDLYRSLLPGNYIMPCSFVFRREAAMKMGLFDESLRYIEDRDFMLRLSKEGSFAFLDRVTVRARVHGSNITHPKNTIRNTYFVLRVLEKALAQAEEYGLDQQEFLLTRAEFRRTANLLMYVSSVEGLKAYMQAVRWLSGKHSAISIINPKHALRALYYTFTHFPRTR